MLSVSYLILFFTLIFNSINLHFTQGLANNYFLTIKKKYFSHLIDGLHD